MLDMNILLIFNIAKFVFHVFQIIQVLRRLLGQLARALAVSDLEQVAIILIIHLSSSFFFLPGCYFSTRRVGARALKFGM